MSKNIEIGTSRCNKIWLNNILKLKEVTVLDEVNLWYSNNRGSKLTEGTLFLFRSKPDENSNEQYIIGGGFFDKAEKNMTYSDAWKYYREANGVTSEKGFHEIAKSKDSNKLIVSYIIRNPFFLDENEWIDYYEVISKEIPKKTPREPLRHFKFGEPETKRIWKSITKKFANIDAHKSIYKDVNNQGDLNRAYQNTRPGQWAFRREILKLFNDTCAVTGINVTEIIEAAHIIPYSVVAKHEISNGIALRADLHKLLDSGYATIRKNGKKFQFIISDRFWKDHNNRSKKYKDWHKKDITMPSGYNLDEKSLEWHHDYHRELLGDVNG